MEKKLVLVAVGVALLYSVGCSQTETAMSSTSTTASDNEATAPAERIQDSDVIQASATVEEPARPSEEERSGEIGATAPAWENLEGVDGKQHSLKDLAEAKAVAVVFTCNTCPVARAYEDRLIELANEYREKGVQVVAINVNKIEGDLLPDMKERAEEKGFTFAYLYDPSQHIARDYGATVTPHVFLLNEERKVVYAGAIDDKQNPDEVKEHHLRDAIDATLAGQTPDPATTKQFGCGIKYE